MFFISSQTASSRKKFISLDIDFTYTGTEQTWVVPAGITKVQFELYGAQGNYAYSASTASRGARLFATYNVIPGETFYIYVGGKPVSNVAGWPNGGAGGLNPSGGNAIGYGGGGSSDVRRGGNAIANQILVAGAGGGEGGHSWAGLDNEAGDGGHGGHPSGSPGGIGRPWNGINYPAGGGTASAGGAAGYNSVGHAPAGVAGSRGQGGAGGNASTQAYNGAGGGGGGGYYGGGGGVGGGYSSPDATQNYGGGSGGGGGSSFYTGQVAAAGDDNYRAGHGFIRIQNIDMM